MRRTVAVNDTGHVIGQDHARSKLSDREVDLVHELHESGMSLKVIGEKFEISKGHAHDICSGRRRGQVAHAWRTLHNPPRLRYRFRPAHVDEFDIVTP